MVTLPQAALIRFPRKLCHRQQRPRLAELPCFRRKRTRREQRVARLSAQLTSQTPLERAMRNAAVMPAQARNILRMADLCSLDAIIHGKGTMHDLRMLIDAGNIAQCLACDFKIGGDEVKNAISLAEMAILQCAARFERTERLGFTGAELTAMREMLEWAHAQREVTTRATYIKAVKLLEARVKSGYNTIELEASCAAINGRRCVVENEAPVR